MIDLHQHPTHYKKTIEDILARMTERRVPEIMHKRDCLGEVLVQLQPASDRAGNLRDLERMRQACSVVVPLMVDEYLSLVFEPPECARFGVDCRPENPVGPCMVSSEGTCAAWYKYSKS